MHFCSNACDKNSGSKLYYINSGKLCIACPLMHTKHLNSVTGCTWGGRKDVLRICAHFGNSAQTDPKKCSFSSKVIDWMVISYMAGTSAGAKVILQSHPRIQSRRMKEPMIQCWREGTWMTGSRCPVSQLPSLCLMRGIIILLWSTIC